MRAEIKKPNVSGIFPILSFVVLSACIVIVLVTGARIYGRANERDSNDYYRRTVTGYITTRVSQSCVKGRYFVGDFHEAVPDSTGDTFFFTETINGKEYVTRLYCYDGAMYELFSPIDVVLDPEYGERVLEVDELGFSIEDDLLTTNIRFSDGKRETLRTFLRAGGADSEK